MYAEAMSTAENRENRPPGIAAIQDGEQHSACCV